MPLKIALFLLVAAFCSTPASAQQKWEYAFVSDRTPEIQVTYPSKAPITLKKPKYTDPNTFLLNIFNRMGSKSWELADGDRGSDNYISNVSNQLVRVKPRLHVP